MLHPINLPQCTAQLYELTELARLTLVFATRYDSNTLPQINTSHSPYRYRNAVAKATNIAEGMVNQIWANYLAFMRSEGREIAGQWLFEQYSVVAKPVVNLVKIPLAQKQSPDIAQLFADDVALLDQLADVLIDLSSYPQFCYQIQKAALNPDVDRFINELMRDFYEKLFRNKGRPIRTDIVGGTEDLNGNVLLKGYVSLHVCPGCDRGHQSIEHGQLQTQIDHFLPLAHYPFFAVHPLNLIPYCVECNSFVVKGDTDVIAASQAAHLNEIFHPHRPAQKYVQVSVKQMSTDLALDINENGQLTKRMAGFLELLNIQSRWEGEFARSANDQPRVEKRIFDQLKSEIKGAERFAKQVNQSFHLDDQWLTTSLNEFAAELPREYGRAPWAITTKAYAEWIRDNSSERNQLLKKLQRIFPGEQGTEHIRASLNAQQEGRRAIGI